MPYAIARISILMMLHGFLMVPGLLAVHFLGIWPVLIVYAAITLRGLAVWLTMLWGNGTSFVSVMLSECDFGWHFHPLVTMLAGLFFALGGYYAYNAVPGDPALDPNAMNHEEQLWFATIFLLVGLGVAGIGFGAWTAPFCAKPNANEELGDET